LRAAQAEALYELSHDDPDCAMGGAMMSDIVDLPECPEAVLDRSLTSRRNTRLRRWESGAGHPLHP
jgi:hypothetical protein